MYKVLTALALDTDTSKVLKLPVWGDSSGFLVISSVHDGRRALELLRNEHYDMTIMEINLPLMDGLQLIRAIHHDNLCPVVVGLSANANFQHARECILYGAFDYLPQNVKHRSDARAVEPGP